MPVRVHALLVVRPDGRTPAAHHLRRTLAALSAQTHPVSHLTIIVCGADPLAADAAAESAADVVSLSGSTRYAEALARVPVADGADAVWLLAQDTAPDPDALARLVAALEVSPSVGVVAPKLVRADDRSSIVSLGVGMTRFGTAVALADGEHDQGQHDRSDDVLGADVRALLVRADAWRDAEGIDPALRGADEGLDLGVRVRLTGARVALVPAAVVAVSGDGVAGPAAPTTSARRRRDAVAARTAHLHRRLAYARTWAVVPLWLAIVPMAVARSILHLLRKQPALIGAEWAAAVVAMARPFAVARSRARIARTRRVAWSVLAPLRVTRDQLRSRLSDGDHTDASATRSELRFFAGGGGWVVLAALAAAVVAFPALLAWPVLGGGGLLPLRAEFAALWGDTAFGLRALGLDTVGPADPFSFVVAVVGTLWPFAPSRALVILWVLALPVAALGGWFAATRVTERPGLRIAGAVLWTLAPTFLVALTQGRPAAVLAHLLLPWLLYAGAVAHRSWSAAGAASVIMLGVTACAPSLVPALVSLWAAAMLLTLFVRAGRGLARVAWTIVPAAVFAAPMVVAAASRGDAWWLLADPGLTWAGPQVAADAAGRALLAAGIPTPDLAGWLTILGDAPSWWVPLLAAPVALLALAAPLTQRWAVGVSFLVVTALGVGTAFAAVGVTVAFHQSVGAALWPGAGLSLAWLGAVAGGLVTLDAGLAPRAPAVRAIAAAVAVGAVVVLAVPSLTAMARGTSLLQNGPAGTLPAYVAAEGAAGDDVGTIVLTPQNGGGVAAEVVWGAGRTLGAQSSLVSTRTTPSEADLRTADLAAALVSGAADDAVAGLAEDGIGFVLLAPSPAPESDAARALRMSALSSIDQREGLDSVGDTARGVLWRVSLPMGERPSVDAEVAGIATGIAVLQVITLLVALLLAAPTTASRRAARRTPRVVGPHWEEGR